MTCRASFVVSCGLLVRRQQVADAFAGLPEQEQSILILRLVLDLTDSEIGEALGLSRSAVQRRRTKSLNVLLIFDSQGRLARSPPFDPEVTAYTAATTNAANVVTATAKAGTVEIKVRDASLESGKPATWAGGGWAWEEERQVWVNAEFRPGNNIFSKYGIGARDVVLRRQEISLHNALRVDGAQETEQIKALSDGELRKEDTGSSVFLRLYGRVVDAMEDFHITLEAQ